MAETTRRYHLGDILTVTTGKLVSPGYLDGVRQLLKWMTGEIPQTFAIGRVLDECRPEMLRQHPDLAGVEVPLGLDTKEKVFAWLATQTAVYGEYRDVGPLAAEDRASIDPMEEWAMRYPQTEVIAVVEPPTKIETSGGGER